MSIIGHQITNKNKVSRFSKFFGGYDGDLYYRVIETFKCDICGEEENRTTQYGLYTGKIAWPLMKLMSIKFGHKSNVIHVCATHKEKEIQEKVNTLLKEI